MESFNLKYIQSSHELYKKWYNLRKAHARTKKLVCSQWLEDRLVFFQWALDNGWHLGVRFYRKDKRKAYSPTNTLLISPFDKVESPKTHQLSVLNVSEVKEIKNLLRDECSQVMIAKKYNVSSTTISSMKTGETWSYIK